MFLEFNTVIIDPLNRNIDVSFLKDIPSISTSDWQPVSEGTSQISISGLTMFNPWVTDFCIRNGILTKKMEPFLPLEKKINLLELMFLPNCMEKSEPEGKERMKRFMEKEGKNIIGN